MTHALGNKMFKLKHNMLILYAVFLLTISNTGLVYAEESKASTFYIPATEALTTFANNVAEAVPKIVASIILLVIGLVAGKIVGRVVEKTTTKILQKTDFQKTTESHIIDHTTGKLNSAKLVAATIRWFVYLFFIVAAVNALQFEQLSTALTDLWLWVPNLLAFVLIIIVGSIIVNFVIKWIDQELLKHGFGGSKYVITGVKIVIYSIVFAVALTQLGIGESIIPTLVSAFSWSIAVAIGAAIAVGLGFALKDILPVIITGAVNQRSIFRVGQQIKIGDTTGTITAVEMLHVIVTNEKNESMVIPTKELMGKTVIILHSESVKSKSND